MSVLLLRLAGPLQAWGSASRFARRTTEVAPTKSGVVGLLAAACGRPRDADLADLAALRFAVRVDQPGTRVRDFHTAHHADTGRAMPVSERFYLADAVFVAAVAGDDELITALHHAVRAPVFLPYLGRRSCPPARPLDIGTLPGDEPDQALRDHPWEASPWYRRRRREATVDLTVHTETPGNGPGDTQRDHPLSFDPRHRRHTLRGLWHTTVTVPNPDALARSGRRPAVVPDHDPTQLLTPTGGA